MLALAVLLTLIGVPLAAGALALGVLLLWWAITAEAGRLEAVCLISAERVAHAMETARKLAVDAVEAASTSEARL
jgi:hypothetical protein